MEGCLEHVFGGEVPHVPGGNREYLLHSIHCTVRLLPDLRITFQLVKISIITGINVFQRHFLIFV